MTNDALQVHTLTVKLKWYDIPKKSATINFKSQEIIIVDSFVQGLIK